MLIYNTVYGSFGRKIRMPQKIKKEENDEQNCQVGN